MNSVSDMATFLRCVIEGFAGHSKSTSKTVPHELHRQQCDNSRTDRREILQSPLIHVRDGAGAAIGANRTNFDIKKSVDRVARFYDISKYTIYSYLDQTRTWRDAENRGDVQ